MSDPARKVWRRGERARLLASFQPGAVLRAASPSPGSPLRVAVGSPACSVRAASTLGQRAVALSLSSFGLEDSQG